MSRQEWESAVAKVSQGSGVAFCLKAEASRQEWESAVAKVSQGSGFLPHEVRNQGECISAGISETAETDQKHDSTA